jgi:RNA polymerase sigma-70 factor (ECF subfamily)
MEERRNRVALDVEALYRKYGPMVLRRCRHLLRDEEKALDAMQDTFVRVVRYGGRLNDRAPSSLLYCMATNVCLNTLRSERRRPKVSGDEILHNIASSEDVEEAAVNRHFLERTLEEVAGHVGLSVSGVRKRLAALKTRSRAGEEARS